MKPVWVISLLLMLGSVQALAAPKGSPWGADYFTNVELINQDGKEIILTNQQIVQIIQNQQEQLIKCERILHEKDSLIKNLINELNNYKKFE